MTKMEQRHLDFIQKVVTDMNDLKGTVQGKGITGNVVIGNIYEGFSPTALVEQTHEGAAITITDKKGTTTASITHGKDGYTPQKDKDYFDGKDGYTPLKGVDYFDGENGKSAYEYAQAGGYNKSEEQFANDLANIGANTYSKDEIDRMIADIKYKEIEITFFRNNGGTVEMGSTVDSVTLTWELSKKATELTIDGTAQDTETSSKALTGLGLKSNKTWTLKATDERDATAEASTTLSFYNGVYYGVGSVGTYDSAFVLGLTKTLTNTRARTVTVSAGEGQYIFYCLPSRLGACSFNVGGFDGGFELVSTMQFTNASGYTEEYNIYKSTNAGLGSTTVKVS